jgi:hypothetical protein
MGDTKVGRDLNTFIEMGEGLWLQPAKLLSAAVTAWSSSVGPAATDPADRVAQTRHGESRTTTRHVAISCG